MSAKATPGPWAVRNQRWVIATHGEHEGEILVSPTYWMEHAKEEAAANAQLIAAAPAMAKALERLVRWDDIGMSVHSENLFDDIIPAARVALRLAKGE